MSKQASNKTSTFPSQTQGLISDSDGEGSAAAPTVSAERQWLNSVLAPMSTPSVPIPPVQESSTSKPPQSRASILLTDDAPRKPANALQAQTPTQQGAQRRMELMQQEIDQVIGVMRMNFDNKCIVQPDRRLSELYHLGPEYDPRWKCQSKREGDKTEKWTRRKRILRDCLIVFGVLLLIFLILLVDYYASSNFITHESETEIVEAKEKRERTTTPKPPKEEKPVKEKKTKPPKPPPVTKMPKPKVEEEEEENEDLVKISLTTSKKPSPSTTTKTTTVKTTTTKKVKVEVVAPKEESKLPRGHDVLDVAYASDEDNSGGTFLDELEEEFKQPPKIMAPQNIRLVQPLPRPPPPKAVPQPLPVPQQPSPKIIPQQPPPNIVPQQPPPKIVPQQPPPKIVPQQQPPAQIPQLPPFRQLQPPPPVQIQPQRQPKVQPKTEEEGEESDDLLVASNDDQYYYIE